MILEIGITTVKGEVVVLKLKKCKFWLLSVTSLGHVISKEGVSVDSQKN